MGLASFVADDESSLQTQLQQTANHKGPVLTGAGSTPVRIRI